MKLSWRFRNWHPVSLSLQCLWRGCHLCLRPVSFLSKSKRLYRSQSTQTDMILCWTFVEEPLAAACLRWDPDQDSSLNQKGYAVPKHSMCGIYADQLNPLAPPQLIGSPIGSPISRVTGRQAKPFFSIKWGGEGRQKNLTTYRSE